MDKPQLTSFKKCSKCGVVWPERFSFLNDRMLRMIGYEADFDKLMAGLLLFARACGATLSIRAGDFQDLYDGPMFIGRLNSTEEFTDYCLNENDLRACPAKCSCAYVREIVQIISNWPKLVKYKK